MEKKKEYTYIGLVGRNQTAAIASVTGSDLGYKERMTMFKFPQSRYYEFMNTLATAIIDKAVEERLNCVIYTIDCIVDVTRAFFKAYRRDKPFDFDSFAENQISYKREFAGADDEMIDNEREALAEYLRSAAKIAGEKGFSVKIDKAKEADQLVLNIPEEAKVEEGDLLSFKDGKTENGISVYGWPQFSREYARVKARHERGASEPIYFIYRNDNTPLGKSKSDMLRYLWNLCPNYEKETYIDLVKVA